MSQLITRLAAWRAARSPEREGGAITVEYGVLILAVVGGLLVAATAFFAGLGGWLEGLIDGLPG